MPNHPPHMESRWPVLLALAGAVGLRLALPRSLSAEPGWVLIAAFAILASLVSYFHYRGREKPSRITGFFLLACVTAALIASLYLLIHSLPAHILSPLELLRAAASLWISNVLVFAAWYWKLDAGGAYARAKAKRHETGAFLFPQMALHENSAAKPVLWHPHFLDYLFLAFNTSTALSPTDTQIYSRWAKVLMMLQSLISLAIIVLLFARAVNIL